MIAENAYWLAWSQISGVGPILLQRLQQNFGTLSQAWQISISAIAEVEGFGSKLLNTIREARSQINPEQFLEEHRRQNPHFWTPADPDYPRLLLEIPSPPPVLYYRGRVIHEKMQGAIPAIAIVGTRHPTEHGKRWTRKISAILAQSGFTITSGMAAGIDSEAHQSCLQVDGYTIAVLGTGVDVVYPASNRKLHQQIEEQGLILSEYPAGTRPDRHHFPPRNRIIAGLSRAVLVMEAPEKSGSLITARYANDFGRDVYALPNSPESQQSRGCLKLLKDGSQIIIDEAELLEMLGAIPQLDTLKQLSLFEEQPETQPIPNLEPELATVLRAIATEPTSLDVIVQKTGLTASAVNAALLHLELIDLVSQLPGMRYLKN